MPGSHASNFSILIFSIAGKGPHCPPCCPSQNQASLLMQSILPGPASISSCWAIAETPGLALGLGWPWMTLYAQAHGTWVNGQWAVSPWEPCCKQAEWPPQMSR